ncbi:MAG: hypothetical protein DMD99_08870 [Candidatus Rokuibacteriota bacterium]|nr:MAG: hypothetical protein DMD99_08870 [Candidatus Rokubacteria bacterium]
MSAQPPATARSSTPSPLKSPEDVRVPLDVPPTDNSAVDGYAVGSADIPAAGTRDLRVPPGLLWWSSTTRAVRPTPLPKELVPKRLIRSGRLPSRVSGDPR